MHSMRCAWVRSIPLSAGNARCFPSKALDVAAANAYCLTLDGASYRAPRQGPKRAKNTLASTPNNIDSCPP